MPTRMSIYSDGESPKGILLAMGKTNKQTNKTLPAQRKLYYWALAEEPNVVTARDTSVQRTLIWHSTAIFYWTVSFMEHHIYSIMILYFSRHSSLSLMWYHFLEMQITFRDQIHVLHLTDGLPHQKENILLLTFADDVSSIENKHSFSESTVIINYIFFIFLNLLSMNI